LVSNKTQIGSFKDTIVFVSPWEGGFSIGGINVCEIQREREVR
jgi:hypothetical protein